VDRQNRLRPWHRIGEKQYMYKLYGLHYYSYLQYTHTFVSVHNNVQNNNNNNNDRLTAFDPGQPG